MFSIVLTVAYLLLTLLLLSKKIVMIERSTQLFLIIIFIADAFFFDSTRSAMDLPTKIIVIVVMVLAMLIYARSHKLRGKLYLFYTKGVEDSIKKVLKKHSDFVQEKKDLIEYNFEDPSKAKAFKEELQEVLKNNPKRDINVFIIQGLLVVYLILLIVV